MEQNDFFHTVDFLELHSFYQIY